MDERTDELREALERWDTSLYTELTEAEENFVRALVAAARSWLNLLNDDNVEAGAQALAPTKFWALMKGRFQDEYRDSARAVLAAVRDRSTG